MTEPLRVAVVGLGVVGARAARHLLMPVDPQADGPRVEVTLIHRSPQRLRFIEQELGPSARYLAGGPEALPDAVDVVVLTIPRGNRVWAEAALERTAHVVSACDEPAEVGSLLALDAEARERERSVAVGSSMAPGLSCVLARWAATRFDEVTEIHVASVGTGGPACARRHHAALSSLATDYIDGAWHRRPGGSGRELVWFPEPVGGADCYRAGLADPGLLVPAFPTARRVTARLEATRRDRMTAWLPMLRPPHPEGLLGAVRVEVRGYRPSTTATRVADTVTVGAAAPPGVAAGAVAAVTALWAGENRLATHGAAGLAEMIGRPAPWLRQVAQRGIRPSVFEGAEDVDAAALGSPVPA